MQILGMILAVLLCGLVLSAVSVGTECRRAVRKNCRNALGSVDWRRIRKETVSFLDYATCLAIPAVISLPVGFWVTSQVTTKVMPATQVTQAVEHLANGAESTDPSLRGLQKDHAKWMREKLGSSEDHIQSVQSVLWHSWPAMVAGVISVAMMGVWVILGWSKQAVQDYVRGIRQRRDLYDLMDAMAVRFDAVNIPTEAAPR